MKLILTTFLTISLTFCISDVELQEISFSDISLHFYTRNNPNVSENYPLDVQQVISSPNFDRTKLNIFTIHGWISDRYDAMNTEIRDATLAAEDVNLFVVDWSEPASGLYILASRRVRSVGEYLGAFIGELQENLQLGADYFKLVGYSLGAHVAGNAGRTVNGSISVIIGLDPAGPLFSQSLSNRKLRKSDAQFVHVIHTNGGLLGYDGDLGHVDVRPNGGRSQPGCVSTIECSHARSYEYYAESIISGGFTAWSCESFNKFSGNECNENPTSRLGGLPVDKEASGRYYLKTTSSSPFSLS